jgi:hypothetical protein
MKLNGRIALVIIVTIVAAIVSFKYWGKYDTGFRSGTVMKLSNKGVVFKTFEGELDLNAIEQRRGEKENDELWYFSVPKKKKDVQQKLKEVSLTGERVELEYYERYWRIPWRGKTKYFVTGVVTK